MIYDIENKISSTKSKMNYNEFKQKLILQDCFKEYHLDNNFQTELKTIYEPISQCSLQAYEYRIEDVKHRASKKISKLNSGISKLNNREEDSNN